MLALIVFSFTIPTLHIKILHWTEIQSFALFSSLCCMYFILSYQHSNEYKRSPPKLIVLLVFSLLIFLISYLYPMLMIVKYYGERIIRLNNSGRLLSCSFKWSQNKHSTDRVWFIYMLYTTIWNAIHWKTHSQSVSKKTTECVKSHVLCIMLYIYV